MHYVLSCDCLLKLKCENKFAWNTMNNKHNEQINCVYNNTPCKL